MLNFSVRRSCKLDALAKHQGGLLVRKDELGDRAPQSNLCSGARSESNGQSIWNHKHVGKPGQLRVMINMLSRFINGLAVHRAAHSSNLHLTHYPFIRKAIQSGITVLETGVESRNYQRNLRFAIVRRKSREPLGFQVADIDFDQGYNSNGLYLAINFLYKVAFMVHREISIDSIVDIFQKVVQMLDAAGVQDHAEVLRGKTYSLSQLSRKLPTPRNDERVQSEILFGEDNAGSLSNTVTSFQNFEISTSYVNRYGINFHSSMASPTSTLQAYSPPPNRSVYHPSTLIRCHFSQIGKGKYGWDLLGP